MPVVRDVGARFIAPACRHTVRWAMYTNCCHEPWRAGLSASYHRGRGEKCGLVAGHCARRWQESGRVSCLSRFGG